MTPESSLPIIKVDKPNHVRTYAAPYLRTASEDREVICAPPRYFLIAPRIDRTALVVAVNNLSKIRTVLTWVFSVVCLTLIWLDFEFLGLNSFVWALLIGNIALHIEHRWFESRLFKMLQPYADHLTEVSVKYSWQSALFGATKLLATILLVLAAVSAFFI